jgi:hypothetical protein
LVFLWGPWVSGLLVSSVGDLLRAFDDRESFVDFLGSIANIRGKVVGFVTKEYRAADFEGFLSEIPGRV